MHVLENALTPGPGGTLRVGKGCRNVTVAGNTVGGRPQEPEDIAGRGEGVRLTRPNRLPDVGPSALPPDGARHLDIDRLRPWDEERMWL